MRLIGKAAALLALGLTACAGTPGETVVGTGDVLDLPLDSTPHVRDAAAASQRLGWQVALASDEPNALVSPSSLSMSVALLGEGALGASQDSITEQTGLAGDERSAAFGALRQSLLGYEQLPKSVSADAPPETPIVHQASQVVAIAAPVEQAFLDRVKAYYDTGATQAEPGEAQAVLDAWVKENTAGLIEKSGVEVTGNTLAVVQDAVLLAAAWETMFDNDQITIQFQGVGEASSVPAVAGLIPARYAEGADWQAVRLPYDDVLSADVILPSGDTTELTTEDLQAIGEALDEAEPSDVAVTMPSFDLETKTDLLQALPDVDLGDIGGIVPGAYVGQWVQQVRLAVSAKGTVGAAVTEAAAEASAPLVTHELYVDRPYVIRVLDTRTGWPLFLGRIGDPTAS